MTAQQQTTSRTHQQTASNITTSLREELLGAEKRTVVLVTDESNRLLDYRVEVLSEVLLTLDLSGFSERVQN